MSWLKYLLLPQIIWHGSRAPRGEPAAWEAYWGAVRTTGVAGDVLWDGASDTERREILGRLLTYADRSLPVVDAGCGNGRYTWALAAHFPRAVGIDRSARAVALARAESPGVANVAFRALDASAPGVGQRLAAELGDSNVFLRGVLHVIGHESRLALLENARRLLGRRGVLCYLETDFQGDLLAYLERLGARPGAIPTPLLRCIAYGLPRPTRFGARQHTRYFPASDWETLASGAAEVHTVATQSPARRERIAGYFGVVRPRQRVPGGGRAPILSPR